MKRLTALLLALLMIVSICPTSTWGEEIDAFISAELRESLKNTMVTNKSAGVDIEATTYKGAATASGSIVISEENFPDANFRSYVADNFDTDSDGVLSVIEREIVQIINRDGCNVTSLGGVEHFPNLRTLYCADNKLTSLNVNNNLLLEGLYCENNQLTSLDVSKNQALHTLCCEHNKLTTLDVSENSALKTLFCHFNDLSSLDVSHNPELVTLYSAVNERLTSIDISNNLLLEDLNCGLGQLTVLDVSKNTKLKSLNCEENQIKSLDVSKNVALESLDCSGNQLSSLDVINNMALEDLDCGENQIKTLDVKANVALRSLDHSGNQIEYIDVEKNSYLEIFNCSRNDLKSIDVSTNTMLIALHCDGNQLAAIDVNNNSELKYFSCSDNQLTVLDMSKNLMLATLDCEYNQLTVLDIEKNPNIDFLRCSRNQLTSLDLHENTMLLEFVGDNNSFRAVLNENKQFDLSTLPGNFDISKASKWTNGTVNGTILTVTDTSLPVTYDYDCGNDHTVRFTLFLEEVKAQYGLAGFNGAKPETWIAGTLTDAMTYANGLSSGTAYIQLLSDVDTTEPLTFASGKTTILDLNGKTIDRGLTAAVEDGNVITVNGNLTLCDTSESAKTAPGKITGGYNDYGGGVYVGYNGTFTMNGGSISGNTASSGGGVYSRETFTMNDGTISQNVAVTGHGGGVYVYPYTSFTMDGGTISQNTAYHQGGGVSNCGTFTMNDGIITENAAESGGGVCVYEGTFTMNDGTISGNNVSHYGGGVYAFATGTFTMNEGTITENTALVHGGGVEIYNGNLIVKGGSITKNSASKAGGGVHVPSGSFTMTDGEISNNTVTSSSYDCGGGGVYIGEEAIFTMNTGTISGNTTYYNGAGVACYGTFNLNSGTITENISTRGTAGVHVYAQGMFNMTDGTISNNIGYGSAGVCLCTSTDDAATFNMSGGAIIGNRSTWEDTSYAGVFLTSKAVMTVSGDATITDNVATDGSPANVWVKGDPMKVSGALAGTIGITVDYAPTEDNPITIAVGSGDPAYTMTASDAAKFTSDNGHLVELDSANNATVLAVRTYPKGDVTLDGEVNADDLTALARHVAKIEALTDSYALQSADVDDNGSLSADDLTKLARYVAKIIPSL